MPSPTVTLRVEFEQPYRGGDNKVHWQQSSATFTVGSDSSVEKELARLKELGYVTERDFHNEVLRTHRRRNFGEPVPVP